MANDWKTSVIVAVIAGSFAAAPGLYASFVNTPRQLNTQMLTVNKTLETELHTVRETLETELSKVQMQTETQIRLQERQEVANILARFDDPKKEYDRGATASCSPLPTHVCYEVPD